MVGLQEINLAGKDYPIHFGQATFADFCDLRDVSESEMWNRLMGDGTKPGDWITLVWCALFHGARRHSGVKSGDPNFVLTQYDVADLLTDTDEGYKKAAELLAKSLPKVKEGEKKAIAEG